MERNTIISVFGEEREKRHGQSLITMELSAVSTNHLVIFIESRKNILLKAKVVVFDLIVGKETYMNSIIINGWKLRLNKKEIWIRKTYLVQIESFYLSCSLECFWKVESFEKPFEANQRVLTRSILISCKWFADWRERTAGISLDGQWSIPSS